jgi:hypothetical protein
LGHAGVPPKLTAATWSLASPVGRVIEVIHEVDVALRSLIEREATDGTEVEVVFDAPTKDWASRRNVPTIDVYLYDIREDLRRRERGLINSYDGDRVTTRHLPPRHFKLSYLVTAWTQRPEDEHRLLSALLSCFLRHDAIPPDLITGPLAEMGLPVPMTIALPPPEDRSFADVWSALGGELKPSLDVVICAPTDTGQQYDAGPPVIKPGAISLGGLGAWPPREAREQHDRSTRARIAAGPGGRSDGAANGTAANSVRSGPQDGPGIGADAAAAGGASPAAPPAGGLARGMSWQEFASSGSRDRPASGAAPADEAAPAERAPSVERGPASDRALPDTTQKPKPQRRRRQGGITEK